MKRAIKFLNDRLSADQLVEKLLVLSETEEVCFLDSSNVSHLDSHFLIAGINPQETHEITDEHPEKTLRLLDRLISQQNSFAIFTISYDFGLKLEKIKPRPKEFPAFDEPDVFLALFDALIVHDYDTRQTYLVGDEKGFGKIEDLLAENLIFQMPDVFGSSEITSNFTKSAYLETIEKIQEFIRRGDTYQTNLTQRLRARLPENLSPQQIFYRLRKNHPAPFASFIKRRDSTVISASPERFFRVKSEIRNPKSQIITTSPIKGTRPRGRDFQADEKLKRELLSSAKDRAENVMIVDLLRSDLGRICEFGSVRVEKLCDLETHPTLFHLVSTVSGALRQNIEFSDILRAVFPCGSITGAPKIRTMQIIDELETAPRGISMGAIGYSIWDLEVGNWELGLKKNYSTINPESEIPIPKSFDLAVAIRTMVVRGGEAVFNVGGGIVIDSIPELEYEETLTKAKALLGAVNGKFIS